MNATSTQADSLVLSLQLSWLYEFRLIWCHEFLSHAFPNTFCSSTTWDRLALALELAQSRFARPGSVWIETLAEARSGRWLIKVDCKFIDEQIGHKLMSEQRQWVVLGEWLGSPPESESKSESESASAFVFWGCCSCTCLLIASIRVNLNPVNRRGDKRAVVVNTRTTSASTQSFLGP